MRRFKVLAVEDRGLDWYAVTYKAIVDKKWVTGELNLKANSVAQAKERAEIRFGNKTLEIPKK
jgi:hypothetical protein